MLKDLFLSLNFRLVPEKIFQMLRKTILSFNWNYHKNQINRVFSCEINIHEIQGVVKELKYLIGVNK